jgi:RimJ/RimL family protein N-acetyltransferase
MIFYEDKSLAMCGLACVLCSKVACPGCLHGGCEESEKCPIYRCASGKGLPGCYACAAFPCTESMFQTMRVRAFNRYAKEFGRSALLERLKENAKNGLVYHNPDGLKGDYDLPTTEDEVMQLIQFGRKNPYQVCPTFETKQFAIRLIAEGDAEDLLVCYGDPRARRLFNTDNCPPGEFENQERMPEMIRGWLNIDYAGGYFIRFSIIDKITRKAVGTIEIYDRKYQQSERTTGILRIDLAPAYETAALLMELLDVATEVFFQIFHVEQILHQAIPEAVERIAALQVKGFIPVDIEGRQHYFVCHQTTG